MANRRLHTQSRVKHVCSHHLVWITRHRGGVMADRFIKAEMKRLIKRVCPWKGFAPEKWHVGDERVHPVVTVPPKYSVAYAVNMIKGKTSAWIKKKTRKIPKGPFWARGYCASTVGLDEHMVRNYVANQQHHQVDLPKLPLWGR